MAMRSMWKGALGFGLVSIPVKMYTAIDEQSIHLNQLHKECRTRVKIPKYCPKCDLRDKKIQEDIKAMTESSRVFPKK